MHLVAPSVAVRWPGWRMLTFAEPLASGSQPQLILALSRTD